MTDRPNILFLFTDEHSASAMRCAGCADVRTPALDRLAAEGVRFDRAYCTFPLCTPSRASLLSGRWPHQCGTMWNERSLDPAAREHGLGNLLSAAGYACAYGGKWHLPYASPMERGHGFEYINAFDDPRLADDVIAFLERPREEPFFVVASFDNPHTICEYGAGRPLAWGPVPEPDSVRACPNLPANHAPAPYEASAAACVRRTDYGPDDWRRYLYTYYRLVEQADAGIGRILDALDRLGLAESTVVVFTSDHGDMMGAHGMHQKHALYEEAVRVPLLVRAPGGRAGAVEPGALVSGLDLYPTFCDYTGFAPPFACDGLSLRPLVERGVPDGWRDHLVAETRFGREQGVDGRMVRTARFKYVVYERGAHREQLYDLDADPGEMVNLVYDERHADTRRAHLELLRAWCRRTGDRFGYHYTHPRIPFILPGDAYGPGDGGLPPDLPLSEPPDTRA